MSVDSKVQLVNNKDLHVDIYNISPFARWSWGKPPEILDPSFRSPHGHIDILYSAD